MPSDMDTRMLFQTTSAHEELRAKIRSFAEEEIKPLAFLMDQNNEFPEEAVKKLGKLGWMGIPYPKEYGGAGLDALSYAIAVEELARVDGDVYKRQILKFTQKTIKERKGELSWSRSFTFASIAVTSLPKLRTHVPVRAGRLR